MEEADAQREEEEEEEDGMQHKNRNPTVMWGTIMCMYSLSYDTVLYDML